MARVQLATFSACGCVHPVLTQTQSTGLGFWFY